LWEIFSHEKTTFTRSRQPVLAMAVQQAPRPAATTGEFREIGKSQTIET
jgi:hypothetical protein